MEIKTVKVMFSSELPENFTGVAQLYWCGDMRWYKDGKLHREDGPAMITLSGNKLWYKNGLLHREDGPAIIDYSGSKTWCLDGITVSPIEVFERLTLEQKEKVIWSLDEWKK